MNPLQNIILQEIETKGPMTIERYMELCLSHPEHGYYQVKQPFGQKGDFITAPEISQMFGEMVAVWVVQLWHQLGRPNPVTLAELGPGRGTLMKDILNVASKYPDFISAVEIALIETSPRLQIQQKETLGATYVSHFGGVEGLPEQPTILVANEFFDALPIRQFVRNDFGWQERLLNTSFSICLSETFTSKPLDKRFPNIETGRVTETSTVLDKISDVITKLISNHSGGALIVDYGEFDGVGDTLQAVRNHNYLDPFSSSGEADLTAHIRFSDLVQNGVEHRFSTQKEFLESMGVIDRQKALEKATGKSLQSDIDRLTGDSEMGILFKVLELFSMPKPPMEKA